MCCSVTQYTIWLYEANFSVVWPCIKQSKPHLSEMSLLALENTFSAAFYWDYLAVSLESQDYSVFPHLPKPFLVLVKVITIQKSPGRVARVALSTLTKLNATDKNSSVTGWMSGLRVASLH